MNYFPHRYRDVAQSFISVEIFFQEFFRHVRHTQNLEQRCEEKSEEKPEEDESFVLVKLSSRPIVYCLPVNENSDSGILQMTAIQMDQKM